MSAHLSRGLLLVEQRKFDLALDEFRHALADEPESSQLSGLMAYCYELTGQLPEAMHWCREAIKYDPKNAQAFHTLARALHGQDAALHLDECLAALRTSISLNPALISNYSYLAFVYAERIDWKNALTTLDEGLRREPQHAELLALRGWCLYHRGREREAFDLLERSLNIDSQFATSHYFLSRMALTEGDYERFQTHIQEASRLNPHLYQIQTLICEMVKARDPVYRRFIVAWMRYRHHYDSHLLLHTGLLMAWLASLIGGCLLFGNSGEPSASFAGLLVVVLLIPIVVAALSLVYWLLSNLVMFVAAEKRSYLPISRVSHSLWLVGILVTLLSVAGLTRWLDVREAELATDLRACCVMMDNRQFAAASQSVRQAIRKATDWTIGPNRILRAAAKAGLNEEFADQSGSSAEEGVSRIYSEFYERMLSKLQGTDDPTGLREKIYADYAEALSSIGNTMQADAVAARASAELLPEDGKLHFFDLKTVRPIEFLAYLKRLGQPTKKFTIGREVRTSGGIKNWIKKEDLPDLASLLVSRTPSARVLYGASAREFCYQSNEGEQAFFLICAYKHRYPPTDATSFDVLSCQECQDCNPTDVAKLLDREKVSYPPIETWTVSVKKKKDRKKFDLL